MANRKIIKTSNIFEGEAFESLAEVPVEKLKPWAADAPLRVVGKPLPRVDAYDKVSGSATYTFDVRLPNMAYARTLRSPYPHAIIKNIDTSRAEGLDGVLAVISHRDTDMPWYWGMTRLFDKHLRFAGDEVACVAADSDEIAEQALRLIQVEYQQLPFVVDPAEAMADGAPKIHEGGNVMRGKPSVYERGSVEAGLQAADEIVEETFSTQVVVHNPTEVHCSVVNWDGDFLTVYDSTQAVFGVRDSVAQSLEIPASHVRVIKKYMGGGFGSKLATGKYTVMAALLARKIGRPVRITLDREEMNLAVGNRPDSVQKLTAGVKRDGTLTALKHYSYGSAGAYPSGAGCSWPLRSIYKCPNVKAEEYTLFINAGPGRPFRAPGHVQGVFALDSLIDMAAEKIGMDPLQFRLKNYAEVDQVSGQPWTTKRLREAYQQGAEAIGWSRRNSRAGAGKGPLKKGIGMASQIWWGGGGPPAYATIKMNRDGSLQVLCGSQDLGTGTYTIVAQVASEVLQVPMNKIHVILGDTAVTPFGPSSGGSQTAPSVTPAVRDAAEQMRAKLLSAAAAILEKPESDLIYGGEKISSAGDMAAALPISKIIREMDESVLVTTGAREANPEGYAVNSFGAQFAEVEVDTQTGKIKVLKIVAAHDIGRTLNRLTLENQFHGGIMQGIGYALMEQRVMDGNTGRVVNGNMHDYKMPLVADMPEIEVIIVSDGDTKLSNVGAKGIGEPAIIPTAGAIANAVYNAIGVRIKSLPMTPDKVLMALQG